MRTYTLYIENSKQVRTASPTSIIGVHVQDWHRLIGPVSGRLLCVLRAQTDLSDSEDEVC